MSALSVLQLVEMKAEKRKCTMVTCYDYWTARILAQTQIDLLLVGDSVAMVMHGFPDTLGATAEMMELHTKAVHRGAPGKLIVGDMPFLSMRKGLPFAMDCVEKLMRAGAHAVKIEGVTGHADIIRHIVQSGVPVMGHLGLTPQSVYAFGGFHVQGRSEGDAQKIYEQALLLEDLGCFALVLECVPSVLAARITSQIKIPTIGIGAGADVDGQVLVLQDLLGGNLGFRPKFLRHFAELEPAILTAVDAFAQAVQTGEYPNPKESYQ